MPSDRWRRWVAAGLPVGKVLLNIAVTFLLFALGLKRSLLQDFSPSFIMQWKYNRRERVREQKNFFLLSFTERIKIQTFSQKVHTHTYTFFPRNNRQDFFPPFISGRKGLVGLINEVGEKKVLPCIRK